MKNVSTKQLLAFCFDQMEKLDKGQIDTEKAREQANLIKQANNLLKHELDRVTTEIKLKQHNDAFNDQLSIRDIES